MIIACINNKGGVGKTTTVVTLARLWQARQPLVVDVDIQGATKLFKTGCERVGASIDEFPKVLRLAKHELLLVDCPGHLGLCAPILRKADAVIMPIKPDIMALKASFRAFAQLARDYPNLRARAFLTQYTPNDTPSRNARDEAREAWGDDLFNTVIYFRRAFDAASSEGQTIIDYAPDSIVAKQYQKLSEEILQWLD